MLLRKLLTLLLPIALVASGSDGGFVLTLDAATPAVLQVEKAGLSRSVRAAAVGCPTGA